METADLLTLLAYHGGSRGAHGLGGAAKLIKTSPRDGNAGQSRARHRCSPWSWGELRFSRLISTACASTSRMEHSRPLVVDNGTGVSHRFRSDQQLHQEVRSERSDS